MDWCVLAKSKGKKKAVVLIWLIFRDACRIWLTLHRPIAVSKKHWRGDDAHWTNVESDWIIALGRGGFGRGRGRGGRGRGRGRRGEEKAEW